MTRLAVFGASGQTGVPLVVQALTKQEDTTVKALVRNPTKMRDMLAKEAPDLKVDGNSRLNIVEIKDIFDPEALSPHLADVDVVVSTLGFGVERPSR